MQNRETIIISVGGSLIVPGDHIDTALLTSLRDLILTETANGRRFILITGGGRTARKYADAAKAVAPLLPEDLDWLGIHATRLNAHLVRTIFRDLAHPVIVTNPDDVLDIPKEAPLVVAAGYRPGASTDLRAVEIAKRVGAHKVVNLSNTDYVYTADPNKDPNAKHIEAITWADFRALIPSEWDPGLNAPFDPIAAKAAETLGVEVAAINGKNLDALRHYLAGEAFVGTRIY